MFLARRKFKIITLSIICLCFATLLYLQVKVVIGVNYLPQSADAIIILGHYIDELNQPSSWLDARLLVGMQLFLGGYAPYIIATGGQGPGDAMPVAYAMQSWLLARGVPYENIITEPYSSSTFENFLYSSIIARQLGIESIIIATNDFHMYRSYNTAAIFFNNIYTANAYVNLDFRKVLAIMREPLSVIKLMFDRFIY